MDQKSTIYITGCRVYLVKHQRRHRTWVQTSPQEYEIDFPFLPRKEADIASAADELTTRLGGDSSEGVSAGLVIPASWCLAHTVELPTARFSDSEALFEFESFVPVELEELTCAVRRLGGGRALVVGVFTEPVRDRPLVRGQVQAADPAAGKPVEFLALSRVVRVTAEVHRVVRHRQGDRPPRRGPSP